MDTLISADDDGGADTYSRLLVDAVAGSSYFVRLISFVAGSTASDRLSVALGAKSVRLLRRRDADGDFGVGCSQQFGVQWGI